MLIARVFTDDCSKWAEVAELLNPMFNNIKKRLQDAITCARQYTVVLYCFNNVLPHSITLQLAF